MESVASGEAVPFAPERPPRAPRNGLGIAGFILACVALVGAIFGPFALAVSLAGIGLGVGGVLRKGPPKSLAIAAIAVGACAAAVSAFASLFWLMAYADMHGH